MVSFEIFLKAMPPSLSELKALPSFCFAFKIPDDRAVTIIYVVRLISKFNKVHSEKTTKFCENSTLRLTDTT